jgi:hypothetical protein
MEIPIEVERQLRVASMSRSAQQRQFTCKVFGSEWDQVVERWTPFIYDFVYASLGPYGTEPLPTILPLHDGMHAAGATASFDPHTGQVRLSPSVEGKMGQTLEKLTHELLHGSLAQFPEGDPFYEEGFVDFSVWVLAHAPVWGEHRQDMIDAAEFNIANRRERAMKDISDWDRKRWAGGLYCSMAFGPYIIARLHRRKAEKNFTW